MNNNKKRVALPQDPNTPIEDEPPFGSTDPWLMPGAPWFLGCGYGSVSYPVERKFD